jgi:hypothetical protein
VQAEREDANGEDLVVGEVGGIHLVGEWLGTRGHPDVPVRRAAVATLEA